MIAIDEFFQYLSYILGLKIQKPRFFQPPFFIKQYEREGQISLHDKFWAISVFSNIFQKFKKAKIVPESFYVL